MAAIDFPAAPVANQLFAAPNGVVYRWTTPPGIWISISVTSSGGDFMATSTNGAGINSSSPITIIFPTVVSGNSGNWYNLTNGRWTPPAGRYRISAGASWYSSSVAIGVWVYLRKNGVTLIGASSWGPASGQSGEAVVEFQVDANGIDWFDVQVMSSGTATPSTINIMWFNAFPFSGIQGPPGLPPDALVLYDEQVLAVAAADMRVTIPPNAKKIEIVYQTLNVGLVDGVLLLQAMQGSTPYGGGTYQNGIFYGNQNTPTSDVTSSGNGFLIIRGRGWSGTLRPIINTTLQTIGGDGSFSGLNVGAAIYINGQCGFSEVFGIADKSTITGFRLVNATAVNFQAGCFMRCFAVI